MVHELGKFPSGSLTAFSVSLLLVGSGGLFSLPILDCCLVWATMSDVGFSAGSFLGLSCVSRSLLM